MTHTSRHVFLYGPPAAGKLTVARALSATYGLKVLDNHLSFDVALRLFEFGTAPFSELVEVLRLSLFRAAASSGVDVVSTFVFAHPGDRGLVTRLVEAATSNAAQVDFVQLLPTREVLEERVTGSSRVNTEKIRELEQLKRLLERFDVQTPINDDDLSIDNSLLTPEDTARQIAEHLGLPAR
jgi:dephospho-CoA kinase